MAEHQHQSSNEQFFNLPPFSLSSSPQHFSECRYSDNQLNSQFESFVTSAGCATASVSCLRRLSSAALQTANLVETSKAAYGHFQYGPAVDGVYVQDLPGRELLKRNYAKGVELMIGHNRYSYCVSI
jgi:carboxylesterase type B